MTAVPVAIAQARGRIYVSRRRDAHAGVVYGALGRWMRMTRELLEDAGARFVTRGRSGDVLLALLERGDVVCVGWDQTGRSQVRAFGRIAPISAGIDHLATASGAPVVPAVALRRRWRIQVTIGPAVTPDADGRVVPVLVRDLEDRLRGRLAQGQDAIAVWLTGRTGSL
jgi:hypothetical protein